LLAINTQVNHAIIAGNLTPFDRALEPLRLITLRDLTPVSGIASLNNEITRQAQIIAYIDDFKLMLILSLFSLPLIFLIRTKRQPQKNAAMAAE
jgi:DHA2 family multidrug resistance protein